MDIEHHQMTGDRNVQEDICEMYGRLVVKKKGKRTLTIGYCVSAEALRECVGLCIVLVMTEWDFGEMLQSLSYLWSGVLMTSPVSVGDRHGICHISRAQMRPLGRPTSASFGTDPSGLRWQNSTDL